ncbi:tryptophan synthase subunit alpha [Roseivirga pacifica]|uniref:tryptophan synthase subunit alpha n=1 Tax=Roseivirga pacifica TaxID=1267423 RepID=UPI002095E2BB|nr:tryptophan synthase subunit alpha [Roseivirga pacifica]MCO6357366.1 tryptophan synthase subunit alpha [Roseivirga pacifica]MCO6367920.1 tryptophan synthase subunit alpha [Roseivirga pacifica]MCO6369598.1 tryptophan synthase subunit alpha [Roseivirga pacifica]MCO6373452.1 tryptophan synthase subunit alpha [Roseivirga pacifica]MCO6377291.1 tryptophan synthase subunit alpha [Roseivirga pacifica]
MNRIEKLFETKPERVLNVYFTAGYPKLDDTLSIIQSLEKSGADLIEVGIPFSDPVADGPTIQESNGVALANGMTVKLLFEQLAELRKSVSIPVVLMGYINPIVQYGVEAFCQKCQEVGVDGLILPDLPMFEYLETYKPMFDAHGLLNIFLITPQTSEARIREIDNNSKGFIYMVSSASTTGAKTGISADQEAYFARVKAMDLKNPTLIGFGISNKETFDKACANANGAIIGSAFIKAISQEGDLDNNINEFVNGVIG